MNTICISIHYQPQFKHYKQITYAGCITHHPKVYWLKRTIIVQVMHLQIWQLKRACLFCLWHLLGQLHWGNSRLDHDQLVHLCPLQAMYCQSNFLYAQCLLGLLGLPHDLVEGLQE